MHLYFEYVCFMYASSCKRGIRRLTSMFNAKIFICRLSWSTSSDFSAIYSWNVRHSSKFKKIQYNPILWCSRSSKIISSCVNWNHVYDFLLVIYSNLRLILHCCWGTATYFLKIAHFSYSAFIFASSDKMIPFKFRKKLCRSWNYTVSVKK